MKEQRLHTPLAYIYLDTDGIESLYAQTVDRLEVELVQSQERGKAGKLTAKLGVGALLGRLAEIGADTEVSLTGKQIREAKTRLAPEHKLSALLRHLTDVSIDVLFTNLPTAAIACSETNRAVYVQLYEKFNLPQFYYGSGVDEVNRDKMVDFEIGPMRRRDDDRYDHSDNYFKKKHYHFYMSASLSKFTRVREEVMGNSSHDAILFRSYQGEDVPLGVFGYLKHLAKLEYQIKPYAIWV